MNEESKQSLEWLFRRMTDNKVTKTISVSCLQFDDTGKGKIVDLFANWADIIACSTGSDNVGHTVVCNGKSRVFYLIPASIIYDANNKYNVIGSGTVLYPKTLVDEIAFLHTEGLTTKHLRIALNAKLIMPYHIVLDCLSAADKVIDIAGKGMESAYVDFIARRGLVVNDLLNPEIFRIKLEKSIKQANLLLRDFDREMIKEVLFQSSLENGFYYHEPTDETDHCFFELDNIIAKYCQYGQVLAPYITDTDTFLRRKLGKKNILLEGTQGSLLDIDYGVYPYVTSNNWTLAGLAKGVGLKESDIDISFGIIKGFYMTRVGAGPLPTELGGEASAAWCNGNGSREQEAMMTDLCFNKTDEFKQGVLIRRRGEEYDVITGQPRRVAWLDLPLLRVALETGAKNIILTKLDVLTGVEKIKICDVYRYEGPDYYYGKKKLKKGSILRKAIVIPEVLKYCVPIYHEFAGWEEDIREIKYFNNLPANLMEIFIFLFEKINALPWIISTGPDRKNTIFL
ncbi:MAG: adenylosuccinate synthase [Patescibacteria group bacterium]|nr:adenylosuccinate synthase [Patescibacteria group bacterium]